jgi:hypothetical protein
VKRIVWVTHPRHLPKAPAGRAVVVDVAFAAAGQWKSKTEPFLQALGDRLAMFIDHHEHKEAWAHHAGDPRYLLVPNKIAHACPELVTPDAVARAGAVDVVVAHHDFDGLLSAVKFWRGGRAPWDAADEDARAVDSPGRGHQLSVVGERYARAMEEAAVVDDKKFALAFNDRLAQALIGGASLELGLDEEVNGLAARARAADDEAKRVVEQHGALEAPDVYVVRVKHKVDNRMRRNLLVFAEERARIGALYEPDPMGGAWLTAATFDERLDLEDVAGFEGGRSDYRFARATKGGHDLVDALSAYSVNIPVALPPVAR